MHATEVIASPGRNNSYQPYGTVYGHHWTVPTAWTRGDINADVGVIRLSRAIGDSTGWLGYAAASDASLRGVGTGYKIIGYPASPYGNGFTQTTSTGPIARFNSAVIGWNQSYTNPYSLRTAPGTSGAGLIASRINLNGRVYSNVIVGVNVRGTEVPGVVGAVAGQAIRLNSSWVSFIQNAQRNLSVPSRPYSNVLGTIPQLAPTGSKFLTPATNGLWQPVAGRQAAPAKAVRQQVMLTNGGVYEVRHLSAAVATPAAAKKAPAWVADDFAGLHVG